MSAVPEVFIFMAPPETVKPALPVNNPAEVMVPVPEVDILPGVVILPEVNVTPVAPVIAPAEEISIDGVERK